MCDEWIIVSSIFGCVGADGCVALYVDGVNVGTSELARTGAGADVLVPCVRVLFPGVGAMLAVTFMCQAIGTSPLDTQMFSDDLI